MYKYSIKKQTNKQTSKQTITKQKQNKNKNKKQKQKQKTKTKNKTNNKQTTKQNKNFFERLVPSLLSIVLLFCLVRLCHVVIWMFCNYFFRDGQSSGLIGLPVFSSIYIYIYIVSLLF